ncbi:MAG: hypothetical protein PF483_06810 [Halothiobacillus sp.]|jgi:hypothetical protein|nr:hypothetical protein [Halothiobacillus sp.]
MIFFFFAVIFMYVGRKVGWSLSRHVLARSHVPSAFVFALVWGVLVAALMYVLIQWQSPNVVLRWIMGYALASYVAIPNFGLVKIPPGVDPSREYISTILSTVPLILYIIAMAALVLSGFKLPVGSG